MLARKTSSILSCRPLLVAASTAALLAVGCNEPAPTELTDASQEAVTADAASALPTLALGGGVVVNVAAVRDGASLAPLSSLKVGAGFALEIDVSAEALAPIKSAAGGSWSLTLKGMAYELTGVRIISVTQHSPLPGETTGYFTIKFQPETVR